MSSPRVSNEISEETIQKIAKLARLELTNDEVALYSKQLGAILEHVSQLSQVNTENIEPLVTATDMAQSFSDDVVRNLPEPELIMSNAPEKSGNLFKVPPVL